MPDCIFNKLYISGNEEGINQIIGSGFKFRNSFPPPPEEDNPERYSETWGQWFYDNWGVKWDVDENVRMRRNKKTTFLNFNTSNSPPIYWIEKVTELFPELSFELIWINCSSYPECGRIEAKGIIITGYKFDSNQGESLGYALIKKYFKDYHYSYKSLRRTTIAKSFDNVPEICKITNHTLMIDKIKDRAMRTFTRSVFQNKDSVIPDEQIAEEMQKHLRIAAATLYPE